MIELFEQFLEQYFKELALVSIIAGFISAFVYLAIFDKNTELMDVIMFTLFWGLIGFVVVWAFPISMPTIMIIYLGLKIKKIRLNLPK